MCHPSLSAPARYKKKKRRREKKKTVQQNTWNQYARKEDVRVIARRNVESYFICTACGLQARNKTIREENLVTMFDSIKVAYSKSAVARLKHSFDLRRRTAAFLIPDNVTTRSRLDNKSMNTTSGFFRIICVTRSFDREKT